MIVFPQVLWYNKTEEDPAVEAVFWKPKPRCGGICKRKWIYARKILYSKQLKRILVLFTALSALCLILSLTYPLARKAQAVNQVGERSLSSMTSFSLAMTYYSDEEISRLAREPGMDDSYKSLCGLLTSVKDAYGYNRVYLLYKGVGGKLYTLLDSGYRDNAREGVDYNGPTTQYKPLSGKAKSAIDKVFSKKEPRITAGGIAETVDGVKVVSSYVPVYSRSGEIWRVGGGCRPFLRDGV